MILKQFRKNVELKLNYSPSGEYGLLFSHLPKHTHTHMHTLNYTHSFPLGWRSSRSAIFLKLGLDLNWILNFIKVMFVKLKQNLYMDIELI